MASQVPLLQHPPRLSCLAPFCASPALGACPVWLGGQDFLRPQWMDPFCPERGVQPPHRRFHGTSSAPPPRSPHWHGCRGSLLGPILTNSFLSELLPPLLPGLSQHPGYCPATDPRGPAPRPVTNARGPLAAWAFASRNRQTRIQQLGWWVNIVLGACASPRQRPDPTLLCPAHRRSSGPRVYIRAQQAGPRLRAWEGGRRTQRGVTCVCPLSQHVCLHPGMGAPVTPAGLLLLLHLTAGTSAEPHYVVVSPAQLYHPHTGTVSVHLSDLNETVRVSVRLERGEGLSNVTLLEREVQEPRLHENLSFQVPAPSRGQQEAAELHLSVRGDTLQFSERTTVLLRVLEPGTFVQTDKAVYKPGQTVKFRIVTLDKDFVPSARPLPLVTLQDPHGNRIAQWRDVTPQQGIVDLSLPLAAKLALGPYAIEVQGTRRWFSVEEYEPPKFEVTLQLPPVVTVLDKTLHLRVCGRYTDGKPVLGRVQATLCRLREKTRRSVCVHLTGQTESDGCLSWEVGTAPFHLTSSDYQMNLEAMASLMEEGTGVVINATRSCLINIVSEIATVTFEEADAAYRAGIPYTGKMLLRAADGSALKNETLRLFVSSGDISENQTFLTDESGRASFTLDTSGWTGLVALRGHFKQAGPRGKRDRVSPRYPDAHHRVEPFYSRSRSFLKFRRLGGELPCGQTQRLHVDYVLAREALGNGSKSLDFIFLLKTESEQCSPFLRGNKQTACQFNNSS